LEKCYVFCGIDENLIKESINSIINKVLDKNFIDLNLIKFDGAKVEIDSIINACETLPFMSDKKVVFIYRVAFLGEKEDRESKKKFEEFRKYIENVPEHTILILYYVFEDDREKPSDQIKKIEKKCCVVKADKLKGEKLLKKVKELFNKKGKEIGRIELKFFCENVENNMDIIENEVDKIINYCDNKEITKDSIQKMLPIKNDNDIFDLVDFLSQKRPEKSIDILNELLYRGENILGILFMVQRQFKLLLNVKIGLEDGKNKDLIIKELRLHPYIGEKLINQSKKFSLGQLSRCLELSLNTEKVLKSSQLDKKTEMELLLINSIRI
jgi:DNA polymerase III, delta subunit